MRLHGGAVDDVLPVHDERLVLAPHEATGAFGTSDEEFRDLPVAVLGLLHRAVLDRGGSGAIREVNRAVEQLADDERFGASLLETAKVDQTGDDDLGCIHAVDSSHRHEHALLSQDLDDDAHHEWLQVFSLRVSIEHDDITQSAQTVTDGVENVEAKEAGDKNSARYVAHLNRLLTCFPLEHLWGSPVAIPRRAVGSLGAGKEK